MLEKIIKITCISGIIAFVLHAAIVPFYQIGNARVITPILLIGIAILFLSFLHRQSWSWLVMFIFAIVQPIISLVSFPTEEYYGRLTIVVQILVSVQALACVTIFILMLIPVTKRWFMGDKIIENLNDEISHKGDILVVTYKNSFWDMAWWNIYQTFRSRTAQVSFIVAIFLIGLVFFEAVSDSQSSFGANVIGFTLLVIALLFGLFLISFIVLIIIFVIRQFDIRSQQKCKLSVSEGGIISETPFKRIGINWSGITKIKQNSRYMMFYVSDQAAIVIPKRYFSEKMDAEKFFNHSSQCLEKAKNASTQ